MNKIILTGYSGFVGQNLTSYIKENNLAQVERLSLRKPYERLPDGDAIIHLAGKAHDLKNTSNPQEYFDINAGLTKTLFDKFLTSPIKDFIYFSSVKAAADTVDGILDEEVKPNPQTPYGKSKREAEIYLLSKVLPPGKRVFILRPCMMHGPGNKGNLNLLFKFVQKGLPYPLAAFENRRSFLSIVNLNYIIVQILTNRDISGGIYNLSDDETLSTNKVIQVIGKVSGNKTRLWKISPFLIKGAAAIGGKLHMPLNSERLKKLTESYIVSNQKIKQALQISNLPLSSEEGLELTIKSFRHN